MNTDLKVKWLEALRSDLYQQVRRMWVSDLRGVKCYCAVGLLDHICGFNCLYSKDPYEALAKKAGMSTIDLFKVIEMNDTDKKSFKEIADFVEANL